MIFLTAGTQLPFDRLVKIVDELVPELSIEVFGQIGSGQYHPRNMNWSESLNAVDFDVHAAKAKVIVSHAGIGSVLTARRFRKPIVLFPRFASLGEHRNDHQLATDSLLNGRQGVFIADDRESLRSALRQACALSPPSGQEQETADRQQLISFLSDALSSDCR